MLGLFKEVLKTFIRREGQRVFVADRVLTTAIPLAASLPAPGVRLKLE